MRKQWCFLLFILAIVSCKTNKKNEVTHLQGNAIGTTYSIKFVGTNAVDFEFKIDSIITQVNKSVSTYIPTSDISKINDGDSTVVVDRIFTDVYENSEKIYQETDGYFDPTVGILVNAWGFGPENIIENLDSTQVEMLLNDVGFDKVKLENGKIFKEKPHIYFDFNAIAKGYLVDLIGELFESHNIFNYLIEIGGEIRARGVNVEGNLWRVAIENPNTDGSQSFSTTVLVSNESMATSGNYRKYKVNEKGQKFVHTINPKTGMAYESNLLSASVFASNCADADAYATALMAMGFEKSIEFLKMHPELKSYLIYVNVAGEVNIFKTDNLQTE